MIRARVRIFIIFLVRLRIYWLFRDRVRIFLILGVGLWSLKFSGGFWYFIILEVRVRIFQILLEFNAYIWKNTPNFPGIAGIYILVFYNDRSPKHSADTLNRKILQTLRFLEIFINANAATPPGFRFGGGILGLGLVGGPGCRAARTPESFKNFKGISL